MTQERDIEAVVTLADANYFPGLEVLHRSVQESHPVPVLCYDIGIDPAQARRARSIPNLEIVPIPETERIRKVRGAGGDRKLAKRGKREWPLWICPYLIAASPYRRTIWLDCDTVCLRNLKELYDLLEDGPVFTPENLAPELTANRPELYDLLPIERDFDIDEPVVNAGVSAWDLRRDAELLEAYGFAVERAFEDERIKEAISWWDQGALVWALQKTGQEGRVLEHLRWNLCIKHTRVAGKSYDWGPEVLEELRADVPDANLIHWNGFNVPWLA